MMLAKEILSHIKRLLESSQAEVLDFVKFLELKSKKDNKVNSSRPNAHQQARARRPGGFDRPRSPGR